MSDDPFDEWLEDAIKDVKEGGAEKADVKGSVPENIFDDFLNNVETKKNPKERKAKKGKVTEEIEEKIFEVFVDSRESDDVFSAFRRAANDPKLLKTLKLDRIIITKKNNMESGDFVVGDCAIEHKSPNDYRKSIMDKHLADQTQTMKRNFRECVIAYSGTPNMLFQDAFGTGTFSSFYAQNIPVMVCGNLDFMAVVVIKTLFKLTDDKVRDHNPSINQKVYTDVQMRIVTSIKDIGEVNGNALLDHFGSIENIVKASIDELREVPGIDIVRAREIYNAFHGLRW